MAQTTPLRERLEQRLKALQAEFETGQKMLADLEAQRASLRDTMLRLAGAITVLQEELDATAGDNQPEPAGEAADERRTG
jgi:hypothetical protein